MLTQEKWFEIEKFLKTRFENPPTKQEFENMIKNYYKEKLKGAE